MASPDVWNDPERAQKLNQEATRLRETVNHFQTLLRQGEDLMVLIELAEEEDDSSVLGEIASGLAAFRKAVKQLELETLLHQPYDHNNAILTIHSGAGGTESQDWAAMLLRMYTRWAEAKRYEVEVLDYLDGEEAGIKSATILIKGPNAYGFLRPEKGVHRLVRISPFDASGRRHTSFASVEVMPEFDEDIEIEIRPEDIKVDTYRSSGAGGQHVNKTESAVRITHLPTGIVVACQSERSQHSNRDRAMKMLKARLYQKQLEEQEAKLAAIQGEQRDIGWGSQIRSYVFHPYNMVKDHRTGQETGNVQAVMDGELDDFIYAYLHQNVAK